MRALEYQLISHCIERGVAFGWNRAHKHNDEPDAESIKMNIEAAVLNEICDWFMFDDHIDYESEKESDS